MEFYECLVGNSLCIPRIINLITKIYCSLGCLLQQLKLYPSVWYFQLLQCLGECVVKNIERNAAMFLFIVYNIAFMYLPHKSNKSNDKLHRFAAVCFGSVLFILWRIIHVFSIKHIQEDLVKCPLQQPPQFLAPPQPHPNTHMIRMILKFND